MTSVERPPRAVLDSDVIFSRVLHELFGRLATEHRLFTLLWSDELLAEAERVLRERKPLPALAARRWVGYLREAFPDERIEVGAEPVSMFTRDPSDEHVCATAIAGHADLLVTRDRGYLNVPLLAHGVLVATPEHVLAMTYDAEPVAVLGSLRAQAGVWGGGRPVEELFEALVRAQVPGLVAKVRRSLR